MNFYQLWEQTDEGIICYHGSRTNGLRIIRAGFPPYKGGLGYGVYVGVKQQTGEFYGPYVYKLRTKFGWESVFRIDYDSYGETWWTDEEHSGQSILVGEMIQPFFFKLKGQIYFVNERMDFEHNYGDDVIELDLDDIGAEVKAAGYKGLYVAGIRAGSSADEELLVFDQNDLELLGQIK